MGVSVRFRLECMVAAWGHAELCKMGRSRSDPRSSISFCASGGCKANLRTGLVSVWTLACFSSFTLVVSLGVLRGMVGRGHCQEPDLVLYDESINSR